MFGFGKKPMEIVEAVLKARAWKYGRLDNDTIITGFGTPLGNCFLSVRYDQERKTLLFLFNPVKAALGAFEALAAGQAPFLQIHEKSGHSEEQVNKLNEFLLHQNYRLLLGAFERDASDGEIRYRVSLPFPDGSPTSQQVNWCIDMGSSTVIKTMQELGAFTGQTPTMV